MEYIDRDTTDPRQCMDVMIRMMKAASDLMLASLYPSFEPYEFGYTKGKKYARFWQNNHHQTFVCFFVDMTTGDVWKADGWKKPALNFTRGNIFTHAGRCAVIGTRDEKRGFHYYGGIA